MKKLSFKPLRRFWRGLSKQMRVSLIVLLCGVLLLSGFGIWLLARPDTPSGGGTVTLFPEVDRAEIKSILIHTETGVEYTVKTRKNTVTGEDGNPITTKSFYLVTADGVERTTLTINSMQLSNLVVGTGAHYVFDEVIRRPDATDAEALAAYEAKLAELGFSADSAFYELSTESGESYRVYYGMKDITGAGYYVMLDGVGTVYPSKTAFVGDLLQQSGPESLIEPTLILPSLNTYAYAFAKNFAVRDYLRVDAKGTPVTERDYGVGYTLKKSDGTTATGSYSLESVEGESAAAALYRAALRSFFLGKKVGECKEKFTFTYPDTEEMGENRGKSHEIEFLSIDYVTRGAQADGTDLRYEISYVFYEVNCTSCGTLNRTMMAAEREEMICTKCGRQLPDERDLSFKYSVHRFTAPADMTNYIPGLDVTAVFESVLKVTGTVVKLGVDDATVSKYGLYRHRVSLSYPYYDTADFDSYLSAYLYVSDVTENGTRYVADPLLYDLVVEVDADALAFLDGDAFAMVDDYVFPTASEDVTGMQIFWNYGAGKWSESAYDFAVRFGTKTDVSGNAYTVIESVKATPVFGGDPITLDGDLYTMLYSRLTYTRYKGEHALSEEELAALLAASDERRVLQIVMSVSDGTANRFEFYPVSADRVAVQVKIGAGAEVSCRFVIYRTALDDIFRAFERLMEGKSFDFEDRYE
ncbi:MAG: hypothetical protein IJV96_06960 [Clostridia bacterium]|nr:hypothetical protein [Clostridia bacterium]